MEDRVTIIAAALMGSGFGPQDTITSRITWAYTTAVTMAAARCTYAGHVGAGVVKKTANNALYQECMFCATHMTT